MVKNMLYTVVPSLLDNPGDNLKVKKEKTANFTPSFQKVVGPPGLEPGTP